jgi:hypothetical protein
MSVRNHVCSHFHHFSFRLHAVNLDLDDDDDDDESQHKLSFLNRHRNKAALKFSIFKATESMCKLNATSLFYLHLTRNFHV